MSLYDGRSPGFVPSSSGLGGRILYLWTEDASLDPVAGRWVNMADRQLAAAHRAGDVGPEGAAPEHRGYLRGGGRDLKTGSRCQKRGYLDTSGARRADLRISSSRGGVECS